MNRQLLNLFADNKAAGKGYEIKAEGDDATIYLYDAIGSWYGIEAKDFVKDLNDITAGTIHLRINSPGGDVFDARAIATVLKQHSAKVIAHIDGLAASAATYIALAADEVEIAQGGFFMIHNAWTIAVGNADDFRDTAEMLDKVDGSIVADYAAKTGQDKKQISDWMAAETWFTADEALEHGFVDRIYTGEDKTEDGSARTAWNLSAYENAPEALKTHPKPVDDINYDHATAQRRLGLFEKYA